MKAGERTLQQLLHAANQYVIPVFQRYYVWKEANWDQMWDDVTLLLEHPEEKRRHFLGSIVCVPESHQPGIIPAYQVIDGQQRLTTLSILLCAIRDAAADSSWVEFAAEVEEYYLIHKFKKGRERYKVYPRLRDRTAFLALVDRQPIEVGGQVIAARNHFARRIADAGLLEAEVELRELFNALTTRLDLVCITLEGENPYKIFRSLNSTGVDLDQGDLIRNHVFMTMTVAEQDAFDDSQWRKLELHFDAGGKLDGRLFAAFFRDMLMESGSYVGEDAIYEAFERAYPLNKLTPVQLVEKLERGACHYDYIRGAVVHPSADVDRALRAIRAISVTTSYPLVLTLLDLHARNLLSPGDLVQSLRAIAGFVLRRFVCGDSSRAYGRWFCAACKVLGTNPLANLTAFFVGKGWPSDEVFVQKFQRFNLYSAKYARAVLEGVELSIQSATEPVALEKCWIEHVLPQAVGDDSDGVAWQAALGENWQAVHAEWVHTPGNLTLVGSDYNIVMQNKAFAAKKPILGASRVYLNKEFADPSLGEWTVETIQDRGVRVGRIAVSVWAGPPTPH